MGGRGILSCAFVVSQLRQCLEDGRAERWRRRWSERQGQSPEGAGAGDRHGESRRRKRWGVAPAQLSGRVPPVRRERRLEWSTSLPSQAGQVSFAGRHTGADRKPCDGHSAHGEGRGWTP